VGKGDRTDYQPGGTNGYSSSSIKGKEDKRGMTWSQLRKWQRLLREQLVRVIDLSFTV